MLNLQRLRNKWVLWAAVLLALGGGAFFALRGSGEAEAETVVTESTVRQGDLKLSWKSDGSADRDEIYLDFSVGGVLKTLNIEQGATISVGQALATVDAQVYEEALATAEINWRKAKAAYESALSARKLSDVEQLQQLNAAKLAFDKAKAEYLPMRQVPDAYSAQELELSRIAYETARNSYEGQLSKFDLMKADTSSVDTQRANLEAAEIALAQARQDLADTTLVSSYDGRVVEISGVPGDYVRSSTDASSSDEGHLFTLSPNERVSVVVAVQEIDYGKLSVGQAAEVCFEAAEGQKYPATVTAVEVIPTIDGNGIVTYGATLVLDAEAPDIQTGMSGTVEFIQKEVKNVLIIPNKAVTMADGKQTVKVKTADGATEVREIVTGFTDGTSAEVVSGLVAGETVLIETVKAGTKP